MSRYRNDKGKEFRGWIGDDGRRQTLRLQKEEEHDGGCCAVSLR